MCDLNSGLQAVSVIIRWVGKYYIALLSLYIYIDNVQVVVKLCCVDVTSVTSILKNQRTRVGYKKCCPHSLWPFLTIYDYDFTSNVSIAPAIAVFNVYNFDHTYDNDFKTVLKPF